MNIPIHKLPFERQCELVMTAYMKQHPDATDDGRVTIGKSIREAVVKVDPVNPRVKSLPAVFDFANCNQTWQLDFTIVFFIRFNSHYALRRSTEGVIPFFVGNDRGHIEKPYEEFEAFMQETSDQIYALLRSDWTPDQA
jgi:hypothetical protein